MPGSSPDDVAKTAEQTAAEGGENKDVKETSAEPSTAEDKAKGEKPDILTAVKAALGKSKTEKAPVSEETDPKSGEAKTPDAKKEGEGEDAESDDLTEEELSRLKPKTKKRIDTLLSERAERDQTIEVLRPKAEQMDKLVDWVREADLNSEEVNQLFEIGKRLKSGTISDLRAAYDAITPIYSSLQQALGEALPADLAQRVAQGEISEADARKLTVAQTSSTLAERNATRASELAEQRKQDEVNQTYVRAVQTAVTEWESSKEKADPDWKLKQPLVTQAIRLAVHEQGYPTTTADAVKIAEAALTDVNKTFGQLAPRKKEVQAVTDVASTPSVAKPKTALEAARLGLAAARKTG